MRSSLCYEDEAAKYEVVSFYGDEAAKYEVVPFDGDEPAKCEFVPLLRGTGLTE